jgi:integrase/recombinase XerD
LRLLRRNLENMSNEMAEITQLRRRMIKDMTIRNLSPATQRSYVHAVAKFARYFGRSPDRLRLEDVHASQVHMVSTGISWPALNQTVCALRFFYDVTLGHAEIPERIVYARTPRTLPVVLSTDEVVRFLETVPSLRCLIPRFDGTIFSEAWKEALWDRFYTAAPPRQRQPVERYSIVKRA